MSYKVYLLDLNAIPLKTAAGKAIVDPLGTYLTKSMGTKPELAGFRLASAHETTVPGNPMPHLRLIFEKA